MDHILHGAVVAGGDDTRLDIGIADGRIAEIAPQIEAEAPVLDVGGRLVAPGFIETHIHLDKACILDRCRSERGDLAEAIDEVARVKREFTAEDVNARARRVLDACIAQGTTHMRTHLEVDPGIGMRGFEGVLPLIDEYRWAIDLEICVFPQEGLLNNPGTDELMVEALERGARVVGAAPYTDSDPAGQIDRVFALARQFDVDIDMHLDFGESADDLDLDQVCNLTERFGYGGRVTVGHVTKLSAASPEHLARVADRMAEAGVACTVLPATDLFLMGRGDEANVRRGVTAAHRLLGHGVNCSLSSNNVLNPFTALRRLFADPHGEPLRQRLPRRRAVGDARLLRHDHAPLGPHPRPRRLRHRLRQGRPTSWCSTRPIRLKRWPRWPRRSTASSAGA